VPRLLPQSPSFTKPERSSSASLPTLSSPIRAQYPSTKLDVYPSSSTKSHDVSGLVKKKIKKIKNIEEVINTIVKIVHDDDQGLLCSHKEGEKNENEEKTSSREMKLITQKEQRNNETRERGEKTEMKMNTQLKMMKKSHYLTSNSSNAVILSTSNQTEERNNNQTTVNPPEEMVSIVTNDVVATNKSPSTSKMNSARGFLTKNKDHGG